MYVKEKCNGCILGKTDCKDELTKIKSEFETKGLSVLIYVKFLRVNKIKTS